MKKLIALMVMMTYMASAIGFSYSLHYCGGKFKEVCFTSDTEKNCCGTKERAGHCCSDKVIKANFKGKHSPSGKSIIAKVIFNHPQLLPSAYQVERTHELVCRTNISRGPAPPLISDLPLYLKNRVLRI